ncbi:MAG: hypothetical protein JO227_15165 [Acetobacteraceae bacterium]|nr:hypothetical protein [Acetobacteraceae bacterium]
MTQPPIFILLSKPDNAFALQWAMPITGLESNGQSAMPPGYGKAYDLYMTIDASGILHTDGTPPLYTSVNVTLWADPGADHGTPSSTVENGARFSNGQTNDIVLATGSLVSATMSINPTTGDRSATYVETMTPTLDGTILLHGSIPTGSQLTEQFTTPADKFQALPQPDGTTVDLVNGGSATVTLNTGNIMLPGLRFLHALPAKG